eukprot:308358_1
MANSQKEQSGTIKWFDPSKRYGFILTNDKKDIFFHQSDVYVLEEFEEKMLKYLKPNANVHFIITKDKKKNKLKAIHIHLNVTFLRPDGGSEIKGIEWCIDHGWLEICQNYWSGEWYQGQKHCYNIPCTNNSSNKQKVYSTVPTNYTCFNCKKKGLHWIMQCPLKSKKSNRNNYSLNETITNLENDCDEYDDESTDNEYDSDEYGYNGMPQFMCDELLCQGIKPWDDDAMDALAVLYDFD